MRHAVSAAMKSGLGVRPQACSTRAHSSRSARNFRQRQKLVGIGAEPREDHALRRIERDPACSIARR